MKMGEELWAAQRERLATRRGTAASVLTVVVVLFGIAGASRSNDPAGGVVGLVICSPLIWWLSWWFAGAMKGTWEQLVAARPPDVSIGRAWQSTSMRQQLRQDNNADIFTDRGGILWRRRTWFLGTGTPPILISRETHEYGSKAQQWEPFYLATYRDRHYWWYDDAFYWTNADHTSQDSVERYTCSWKNRQRLERGNALYQLVCRGIVKEGNVPTMLCFPGHSGSIVIFALRRLLKPLPVFQNMKPGGLMNL